MTKPARSQTTLSPKSAAGSTVYNAYYYFTQLSGFYAAGMECAKPPEEKKIWIMLSDSGLEDVGALFTVWEWVLKEIRSGTMKPEIEVHWNRVALACNRMAVIHRYTNGWTSIHRWCRLGLRCESRWLKILKGFEAQDPRLSELLKPLCVSAEKRHDILQKAEQRLASAEKAVNAWFVADDSVSMGPMGKHGGTDPAGSKEGSATKPPKLKIAGAP